MTKPFFKDELRVEVATRHMALSMLLRSRIIFRTLSFPQAPAAPGTGSYLENLLLIAQAEGMANCLELVTH